MLTKYRRTLAIAFSLVLHALVIFGLTLSDSPHLATVTPATSGQQVEGLQLDLADLHSIPAPGQLYSPPQLTPAKPDPMSAFMKMTEPAISSGPQKSGATSSAHSLTEALGSNPFLAPLQSAPTVQGKQEAHVKIGNGDNKTASDLWKAIAPCWDRLADNNTMDVTLQVSFSPLGNLLKQPTILRKSGSLVTDQSLRSESLAITAISQCGPYLMAYGQQQVEVTFPRKIS